MPRERNPNREKAHQLFKDHNGSITNRRIAELLGENEKVIAVWKQRDAWIVVQHKQPDVVQQKKRGGQQGNRNAKGNRGGHGGPVGNDKAVTHGLFQRYLPPDTLKIMEQLESRLPIDILWDNIMIQYTAIIRAQQIMNVKDQADETKVLKKVTETEHGGTNEWEYQHAWDKQATFLTAQSRAMSTLQSLIRQYEELLKTDLATEEQKARIELLRSKVPNKDGFDPTKQITALADLINNPAPERVISDD